MLSATLTETELSLSISIAIINTLLALEVQSSCKLKVARGIGAADDSQAAACAGARIAPICAIEDVEGIRLEDQACAFSRESETLAQRHIPIVIGRTKDTSHRSVAGGGVRRHNESRVWPAGQRIKPAYFSCRASRQIAYCPWANIGTAEERGATGANGLVGGDRKRLARLCTGDAAERPATECFTQPAILALEERKLICVSCNKDVPAIEA